MPHSKRHYSDSGSRHWQPSSASETAPGDFAERIRCELIQQHNDAPSLFRDFLDSGREGLQHLAFWTQNFDADLAKYCKAGYAIVQTAGLGGPDNRNAFIIRNADDPLAIEISEVSRSKGKFFQQIADAANDLAGSPEALGPMLGQLCKLIVDRGDLFVALRNPAHYSFDAGVVHVFSPQAHFLRVLTPMNSSVS